MSVYVYEHILARHYGWSLNEIRAMDLQDFYIHLRICSVREDVEREFQAKLATGNFGGSSGESNINEEQESSSVKRLGSGAITETKNQSNKIRKSVGGLVMNKKTGKVVRYNQPEFSE